MPAGFSKVSSGKRRSKPVTRSLPSVVMRLTSTCLILFAKPLPVREETGRRQELGGIFNDGGGGRLETIGTSNTVDGMTCLNKIKIFFT